MNKEKKRITVITKVTSSCNLNCPYCYTRSTIKQKNPHMTIDIFEKIVQNLAMNYEQATIIFHGGEPTLLPLEWYKQAVDIVNKYKKMYDISIRLAMQTNLTLFDEEKFKFLSDNDIGVGFSYDGMTNHLTRKNDEIILNNYKKYRELTGRVIGNICLITANNYKTLEKDFLLFEKLNLRAKFNMVFNTVTMEGNLIQLDIDTVVNKFAFLFKRVLLAKKHCLEDMFFPYVYFLNNKKREATQLCYRQDCRTKWISVHYNGDLYPCGQEWGQKNKNYLLGNINTHSFKEAFSDKPFKVFSEKIQMKMDRCKKECDIFEFCNGGCPGETFSNTGDVDKENIQHCDFEKGMMKMVNEILIENKGKIINKSILNILEK